MEKLMDTEKRDDLERLMEFLGDPANFFKEKKSWQESLVNFWVLSYFTTYSPANTLKREKRCSNYNYLLN